MANSNFIRQEGIWIPVHLRPKDTVFKEPVVHVKVVEDWKTTEQVDYKLGFQGGAIVENPANVYNPDGSNGPRGWKFFDGKPAMTGLQNKVFADSAYPPNMGGRWQVGFAIEKIDRNNPVANFKGILFEANATTTFLYKVDGSLNDNNSFTYLLSVPHRFSIYFIQLSPVTGRNDEGKYMAGGIVAGRVPSTYFFDIDLYDIFKEENGLIGHTHPYIMLGSVPSAVNSYPL